MSRRSDPFEGSRDRPATPGLGFATLWSQRLLDLPSLWVVEDSPQWTAWLRRELRLAKVNVRCCSQLPKTELEGTRPLAVAWSVGFENFAETLESMWHLSRRRAATIQLALVADTAFASVGCGLRELGVCHIQYDWASAAVIDRLLDRYWQLQDTPCRDVLDAVIRQLPLRPG